MDISSLIFSNNVILYSFLSLDRENAAQLFSFQYKVQPVETTDLRI